LPDTAEIVDRFVEQAVEPGTHCRTKVVVERRRVVPEGREDEAAVAVDPQLLEAMVLRIEIGRHAGRSFNTVAEGHAPQVAARIVAPLMVDTDVAFRVAARGPADRRAPMRASIDPRRKAPVFTARDYHRRITDKSTFEVAGIGNLRFHCEVAPYRPTEDPLLLQLINVGRAIDLERHTGAVGAREINELLGP